MKGRGEYNDPIMRRLNARGWARVLTKVATLASLLILLCAVAAWFGTRDGGGWWRVLQGPHASYVASISGGYFTFQIASINPDPERPATLGWQWFGGPTLPFVAVGSLADPSIFSRVGLFRTMERIPYNDGLLGQDPSVTSMQVNAYCRSFIIPLWMIALAAAVMPARWMVGWMRRRIRQSRIEQGRCGECGYDLRATLEKCPECGSVKEAVGS